MAKEKPPGGGGRLSLGRRDSPFSPRLSVVKEESPEVLTVEGREVSPIALEG